MKKKQAVKSGSKSASRNAGAPSASQSVAPVPAPSASVAEGAGKWVVVEHAVSVAAAPAAVWHAMVSQADRWWNPGFFALPTSKRMTIEPRLGGRMYESGDDGSAVVWFTVTGVQPGRALDLLGHLSPAFGGPAVAMLRLEVEPEGAGSRVKAVEARVGAVDDDCARCTKKGWSVLLEGGLKPLCEGR